MQEQKQIFEGYIKEIWKWDWLYYDVSEKLYKSIKKSKLSSNDVWQLWLNLLETVKPKENKKKFWKLVLPYLQGYYHLDASLWDDYEIDIDLLHSNFDYGDIKVQLIATTSIKTFGDFHRKRFTVTVSSDQSSIVRYDSWEWYENELNYYYNKKSDDWLIKKEDMENERKEIYKIYARCMKTNKEFYHERLNWQRQLVLLMENPTKENIENLIWSEKNNIKKIEISKEKVSFVLDREWLEIEKWTYNAYVEIIKDNIWNWVMEVTSYWLDEWVFREADIEVEKNKIEDVEMSKEKLINPVKQTVIISWNYAQNLQKLHSKHKIWYEFRQKLFYNSDDIENMYILYLK